MSTCSVTTVGLPFITSGTTGRKKRSLIEQRPVIKREDGQVVDFRPSKVQEVETFQTAGPEEVNLISKLVKLSQKLEIQNTV